MENFKKLGLSEDTLKALKKKGFENPTPIQEKTIPILLEGEFDIVAQSQTGTGKTACFALPIIESLKKHSKELRAIVLTPTRELAVQVTNEMNSLQGDQHLKFLSVYGGTSISNQIRALRSGVDVVVGTPGRVMDLMDRKVLDLKNIQYFVLDEADEMLNMGFVEDIEKILKSTHDDKNMLLFSATMPKQILNIAERFMRKYLVVKSESKQITTSLTDQFYYDVRGNDRYECVKRVIAMNPDFYAIIFCKTKAETDILAHHLIEDKFPAAALHGNISQVQRESILNQFKKKNITILAATDVAARGIDVNDLTHVINYSLPQSPETYVHRIGRTGRAGKEGNAITFVMPSEKRQLKFIERIIDKKLTKREIPTIEQVIDSKKVHIDETLRKILDGNGTKEYDSIAENLLTHFDAKKVISSVLRYAFQNELNAQSYKQIRPLTEREQSGYGSRGGRSGYRGRDGSRSSGYRGRSNNNHGGSRDGNRLSGYRGRSDGNRDSSRSRGSRGSYSGSRTSSGDRNRSSGRGDYSSGSSRSSNGRSSYSGNRSSSGSRSSGSRSSGSRVRRY